MKQVYLGDGAYVTIDRDFEGQFILTANHHDPAQATDRVHLEMREIETLVASLRAEGHRLGNDPEEEES